MLLLHPRDLHFKNQLFEELPRRLGTNHHFTAAYSPWANGSVERLDRDILSVLRTILNEQRLPFDLWPYLLPVVQDVLNSARVDSLGHRCPEEIFMHLAPSRPASVILQRNG